MTKIDDSLSNIFDIELEKEEQIENLPVVIEEPVSDTIDSERDILLAQNNIKNLLIKGDAAISNLFEVAKQSESPRAYEVYAGLIKTLSDLNKDLIEIHKKRKEINTNTAKQNSSIDKAVIFTGSTAEIVRLIKETK